MSQSARAPGFLATVRIVLGLRFRLALRGITRRGAIGAAVAALLALGLSAGLGVGCTLLFTGVPAIVSNPIWLSFTTGMVFFLLGLFWVLWPVVAAQINEAHELGRFLQYPIRPLKLVGIQSVAGLAEPAVLFFYPALIGSGLGVGRALHLEPAPVVLLLVCFALMNFLAGRFLQAVFLNLMTSRRSGELLFALFLGLLGLSAFLPPVDASWLFNRLEGFGARPDDLNALIRTARVLAETPPGWAATGLLAAARGEIRTVWGCAGLMLGLGGVLWMAGLWLVKRYARGGRGLPAFGGRRRRRLAGRTWVLPWVTDPVSAVFQKEARTLLSNPKARLLFAVPFFLLILLKIIGAQELLRYVWGASWAAVLLSFLGLYTLSVLAGQFFSNGFGYDGPGIRMVFLVPAPPQVWLVGRNLAQAVFTTVQFGLLAMLVFLLLPGAGAARLGVPLMGFGLFLPVVLAAGNLLSARYPRRFHLNMGRRDRPVGASFMWILGILSVLGLTCVGWLGVIGPRPAGIWLGFAPLPPLGLGLYLASLPVATRWMVARREQIIHQINLVG